MTAPPARDPDLAGAEAALLRARRRAVERRLRAAPAQERDPRLDEALARSKENLVWVADLLNGLEIPALPRDRRVQLAAGSQHLAIEHGQAIVTLIDRAFYGPALALLRPMLEAHIRGIWLRARATDNEVAAAAEDRFPRLERMIEGVEPLQDLKQKFWSYPSSYTHGGTHQIGARLSPSELGTAAGRDMAEGALQRSDWVQLVAAAELARAASNQPLVETFLDRMCRIGPPLGSVTAP